MQSKIADAVADKERIAAARQADKTLDDALILFHKIAAAVAVRFCRQKVPAAEKENGDQEEAKAIAQRVNAVMPSP